MQSGVEPVECNVRHALPLGFVSERHRVSINDPKRAYLKEDGVNRLLISFRNQIVHLYRAFVLYIQLSSSLEFEGIA